MALNDIYERIGVQTRASSWYEVNNDLLLLTNELKKDQFRFDSGRDVFNTLNKVLPQIWSQVEIAYVEDNTNVQPDNSILLQNLTECFRILRNACAGCQENQSLIFLFPEKLNVTRKVLDKLSEIYTLPNILMTLRCAVQFLGNLCVGNPTNQVEVYNGFLPILSLLLIEDILLIPDFIGNLSIKTTLRERLFIVEVMIDILKKNDLTKKQPIHISNMKYLSNEIHQHSLQVLAVGMEDCPEGDISWLLVKMIEVLGLATSSLPEVYTDLQTDTQLLLNAINLLKSVDEIGKKGTNHFNAVDKMSELENVDSNHPVYGLKRDLIRLIANMVNKHKDNQDKVREVEGIQLLLNQTNIDGKNPYITQWVVLAIHNLCEGNELNKATISGLQLQGVVNNAPVLNELGIETRMEGDRVVIKKTRYDGES
ncbi:ataxin-10 isoform X2 [Patella vulgata]|uniref:ataxin-10 isoform X2 n=1 Tax=Patella vulgata TaxID=6465 RepID=UPI0024A7C81F|nr:ataxin-10 isoform X2 [Patella vulgata]